MRRMGADQAGQCTARAGTPPARAGLKDWQATLAIAGGLQALIAKAVRSLGRPVSPAMKNAPKVVFFILARPARR